MQPSGDGEGRGTMRGRDAKREKILGQDPQDLGPVDDGGASETAGWELVGGNPGRPTGK